ncbi:hypothetical protein SDC9_102866 [bioreactor metagenome]|uniref:Uncharacterized protein n=1 Tax=bioreactor metagenome TaxID=1076179 RepID=A0A645ASL3_9ZZZZ
MNHQHGNGQRQHQFHHGAERPDGCLQHWTRNLDGAKGVGVDAPRRDDDDASHQQRADHGRQPSAKARQGRQGKPDDHHGGSDGDVGMQRAYQIQPEAQEHTCHHAHDDGHGHGLHGAFDPSRGTQNQYEDAGGVERTHDFRKLQMRQCRTYQHRAGYRPGKSQWLAVGPTHQDADQPVDEEHAEDPGGEFGFAQPSTGARRKNDGHRCRGREDPADESVGDAGGIEVCQQAPWAGRALRRFFQVREKMRHKRCSVGWTTVRGA